MIFDTVLLTFSKSWVGEASTAHPVPICATSYQRIHTKQGPILSDILFQKVKSALLLSKNSFQVVVLTIRETIPTSKSQQFQQYIMLSENSFLAVIINAVWEFTQNSVNTVREESWRNSEMAKITKTNNANFCRS